MRRIACNSQHVSARAQPLSLLPCQIRCVPRGASAGSSRGEPAAPYPSAAWSPAGQRRSRSAEPTRSLTTGNGTMATSRYWLAQWLDDNDIRHDWEIDHVLNSKSGRRNCLNTIREASQQTQPEVTQNTDLSQLSDSIVAGRRLDLSGTVSCSSYGCLRKDIDSSFKRLWHYFDRIVVEGRPCSPRRPPGQDG